MKHARLLLLTTTLVLTFGCTRNHFVVDLTPDGECIQRRITVWNETTGEKSQKSALPDEQIQRIAKAYENPSRRLEDAREVFEGRFCDAAPDDIGGAGGLTRFDSALGTLSVYTERFRGDDALDAALVRRREAADTLVDLLIEWFDAELAGDALQEPARRFLDQQFRPDIKNLSVYEWTLESASLFDEDADEEFIVRVLHYLVERDYFSATDMPALTRVLTTNEPSRLLAFVQRIVARKLGVPDTAPVPPALAFLSDTTQLENSLNANLRGSDFYQARLREWTADEEMPSDAVPPEPTAIFSELVLDVFTGVRLESADLVEVHFHLDEEPAATNGDWKADEKTVVWSRMLNEHRALPMLVYVMWSEPDDNAQSDYFGKVILRGDDLASYVLWDRGLTAQESSEWSEFLGEIAGLSTDEEIAGRLESFEFTSTAVAPNGADAQPSAVETARELILSNLTTK